MPPKFSKAKANQAIRQLRRSATDLKRAGQQLEAAGRQLERENRRTQTRLHQLPQARPRTSAFEEELLGSVREHVAADPIDREHDVFLSHASADIDVARGLRDELVSLGVEVWLDDFSIKLGQNIVRAIDRGIASARVGVVLVTPAVIAGRYWVEQEFSALLNSKDTVIPVLHEVAWEELAAYSPLLHLKKGLTTADRAVSEIATLIAETLTAPAA